MHRRYGLCEWLGKPCFWLFINLTIAGVVLTEIVSTGPDHSAELNRQRVLQLPPDKSPKIGAAAPALQLAASDGWRAVSLASLYRDKPVLLIFGSYTCPPFRQRLQAFNALYERYRDRVDVYFVYIREAHPETVADLTETAAADPPAEVEETVGPGQTVASRVQTARRCVSQLDLQMPVLLDTAGNGAESAFVAWPSRAYLLDRSGTVIYRSAAATNIDLPELLAALETLTSVTSSHAADRRRHSSMQADRSRCLAQSHGRTSPG
jgi:glutathione peroxidase-family protein